MSIECFIFCNRFLRGDQYAIALALLDEGKVVLGVLACPNLPLVSISGDSQHSSNDEVGCLFFAKVGAGTYMQSLDGSLPKKVLTCRKLYQCILYLYRYLALQTSFLFIACCRCMSVLLKIQWKHHSLNPLKQHTPCMTCLAPLQK